MSATAFQRARRLAAQRLELEEETAPVGYSGAMNILRQPALEQEQADESEETKPTLTCEQREAELKAGNWEALRDLLKSYGLSTNKPKAQSWDEFAIPQILKHEGF
ncbi:MAG TPA: hypothetical protein V6C65_21585 [Allocoleopsis sp.]